jgi:hypothetical protein
MLAIFGSVAPSLGTSLFTASFLGVHADNAVVMRNTVDAAGLILAPLLLSYLQGAGKQVLSGLPQSESEAGQSQPDGKTGEIT